MNSVQLPATRILVEHTPLDTLSLEAILEHSRTRTACYLNVQYPDVQDIIFLIGGKAVKAGRFQPGGREIITVAEALNRLKTHPQTRFTLCEISKVVMVVIMGTFIFEPTQAALKSKLINFNSLLTLFERKGFTGYVELFIKDSLNYLTFYAGHPREGYFGLTDSKEAIQNPVQWMSDMVERSDEGGEINVYQSVGEEDLQADKTPHPQVSKPSEPPTEAEKNEFTAEIIDLCLIAIYEELFQVIAETLLKNLPAKQAELFFRESLSQAEIQHPELFHGVTLRDDNTPMQAGYLNFEKIMRGRDTIPVERRDMELQKGINFLAFLWLRSMRQLLGVKVFDELAQTLTEFLSVSKKNYQGNFSIVKAIYEFSRVIEKVQEVGGA
jgi:hypothetical protein